MVVQTITVVPDAPGVCANVQHEIAMRVPFRWIFVFVTFTCGCAAFPRAGGSGEPDGERPKTLLTWAVGNEPDDKKPGEAKNGVNGNGKGSKGENEKHGKVNEDPQAAPSPAPRDREEPLASDRPDFTEASSTVGKGRIQLESGYTYTRDSSAGVTTTGHSYPEALLRVGMLADWFEFRLGQNFGNTRTGSPDGVFGANGGEDLYLGVKLGLTERKGLLPETALILQTTVPTGHEDFTASRVNPGVNFLFGSTLIEDRLTLGGSFQMNRASDDLRHSYIEFAQSLTVGYGLTKKLGAYTEWFAFYPSGAVAPGVGPQHYFNGGFTYRLTPNLQFDIRAGVGLNRQADDFFAGTGFAVRY